MTKNSKSTQTCIRFPHETYDALKKIADSTGQPIARLVIKAVEQSLRDRNESDR
jgi:predicted DNA-binding protein